MHNQAYRIAFIICILTNSLLSDVKSTQDTLQFNVLADDKIEMQLSENGLGIGISPSSNLSVQGNTYISHQIKVGTTTSNSNAQLNGSISFGPTFYNTDATLSDESIVLVDSSSDNVTLTLPYAGNVEGRTYHIKKIKADNEVIIQGGGNLIDEAEAIELKNYNSYGLPQVSLTSSRGQWWVIQEKHRHDIIASDNMIRWYKFEENSGTSVTDSSSSKVSGTLLGGFTMADSTLTGKIGKQALSFDGSDNRVEADDLDLPTHEKMTISLCANTSVSQSGTSSIGYMVSKDQFHGSSPYNMSVDSSNKFRCVVSGTQAAASPVINDGEWHHCVMVIDGDDLLNYFDGTFQSNIAISHDDSNDELFTIGSSDAGTTYRPFSGNIDDIRVFDKALSAEEISNLYLMGNQ